MANTTRGITGHLFTLREATTKRQNAILLPGPEKAKVTLGAFLFFFLSEVVGREHALGAPQDGVLGSVVGMFLGRDLQHCRDGLHVGVDGVTDHFGDELVDEDDADVIASQEAPGTRKQQQNNNRKRP